MPQPPDIPDWLANEHGVPHLRHPRSILDFVNYQMHLIESVNSSHVMRICEGECGITHSEWRFIGLLAALGSMAPSDLAVRAGMDRSRTSKALMALLAKDLIERRAQPGDHRRAIIALTDAGRALYDRIFPRAQKVNTELLSVLTDAEAETMARLLNKLRRRAVELINAQPVRAAVDRRRGGSRRVWPGGPG